MTTKRKVAVIGAGVSGLSSAILLAENGFDTAILADEIGDETNSAAAAAIWYPYDVGLSGETIAWAMSAHRRFAELARDTGVSLTELRVFSRVGPIAPPGWAKSFRTRTLSDAEIPGVFASGFAIKVPLIETGKYLEYLAKRLVNAGGSMSGGVRIDDLSNVDRQFDLIVNCSGIGARELVPDAGMEPHRGQIAVVQKFDLPYAIVCDDPPLMYAIPRSEDCVIGGTNDISDNRAADSRTTAALLAECERALERPAPPLIRERVGLRPGRSGGVRVAMEKLPDGRTVIHNYGHGGSGFTLSWGCAETVLELATGRVCRESPRPCD